MNKIIRFIIKETLFSWVVASIIMYVVGIFLKNRTFMIMSVISLFCSKILFDNYSEKYYLTKYNDKVVIYDNQ